LQRLPAQVEAIEQRILPLQPGDDAEALDVVVEASARGHDLVERALARMPERRMPEVVGQRRRPGQAPARPRRGREGPCALRRLEAGREPRAVVVALVKDEYLRLVHETPERGRMQHPVTVALDLVAGRTGRLGIEAAAAGTATRGIGRQSATAGRQFG